MNDANIKTNNSIGTTLCQKSNPKSNDCWNETPWYANDASLWRELWLFVSRKTNKTNNGKYDMKKYVWGIAHFISNKIRMCYYCEKHHIPTSENNHMYVAPFFYRRGLCSWGSSGNIYTQQMLNRKMNLTGVQHTRRQLDNLIKEQFVEAVFLIVMDILSCVPARYLLKIKKQGNRTYSFYMNNVGF